MSRSLRIEYPGALYHITMRGNRKQDIFFDNRDRLTFLKLLGHVVNTYNLICHSYCLMTNHYHLLIETPDANLSTGMRDLNGMYTQAFNKNHQIVGHLFQGRYKAFLIEKEGYLLEVARYIVLNPVRAGFVSHPKNWKWSSYCAFVERVRVPSFLFTNYILQHFSSRKQTAQKQYEQFVMDGIALVSPFIGARRGMLIGSSMFEHEVWRKVNKNIEEIKEIPREQRIIGRPSLKEIFDERDRNSKNERDHLICFARLRCGYSISDIAKQVGLSATSVSLIVHGKR